MLTHVRTTIDRSRLLPRLSANPRQPKRQVRVPPRHGHLLHCVRNTDACSDGRQAVLLLCRHGHLLCVCIFRCSYVVLIMLHEDTTVVFGLGSGNVQPAMSFHTPAIHPCVPQPLAQSNAPPPVVAGVKNYFTNIAQTKSALTLNDLETVDDAWTCVTHSDREG